MSTLVQQALAVADKPELLGAFVAQIDTAALARRVRHKVPSLNESEAMSLVYDAILTIVRSPGLKNTRNFLQVVTLQAIQDGYRQAWSTSSMLSGTSAQQWRYYEVVKTRREFDQQGHDYTDADLVEATNKRLTATRKDAKRQGMVVTAADIAMGHGQTELPICLPDGADEFESSTTLTDIANLANSRGIPTGFALWFTRHCLTTGTAPTISEVRDWGLGPDTREHMLSLIASYINGPQRGFFIAVEGIHGAGVSTAGRALRVQFKNLHRDIVTFKLKDSKEENPRRWALAMMSYIAGQTKAIRTALDAGAIVIAERWVSHIIAGGEARGLDMDQLAGFAGWAAGGLMPDLSVLVDVSPALANERRPALFPAFDEWEREALLVLAEKEPEWWHVADGGQPKKEMTVDIVEKALHEIRA